MSQLHSGQKKSQQNAHNHSNTLKKYMRTHSDTPTCTQQTDSAKKTTLQSAFNYLYGYLCKRLIITLQIPVKKLVYMQGLVTPQDLGFLQCKVSSTKSLLNWIWDMHKYVSRCAQINCIVTIHVLCTWSVLKVKSVFLSVLREQLCLDAMDNGVVTFTILQIFAFEIVISIGIHAKGNFTGLKFCNGFKLVMWFRRIDQHNVFKLKIIISVEIQAKENFPWEWNILQLVQIGHVNPPHWPAESCLV